MLNERLRRLVLRAIGGQIHEESELRLEGKLQNLVGIVWRHGPFAYGSGHPQAHPLLAGVLSGENQNPRSGPASAGFSHYWGNLGLSDSKDRFLHDRRCKSCKICINHLLHLVVVPFPQRG